MAFQMCHRPRIQYGIRHICHGHRTRLMTRFVTRRGFACSALNSSQTSSPGMIYPKRELSRKKGNFRFSSFFVILARNDLRNLRIHSSDTDKGTWNMKEPTKIVCLFPFLNTPITVLYTCLSKLFTYTSHHTLKESITILWILSFFKSLHCFNISKVQLLI